MSAIAYTEHSGTINSETWGAGTHYVTASVTVNDNQVLTIQPGAVVKFARNTQLLVYGKLKASGTGVGNSIVFTSRDDDTTGEIIAGSDGAPAVGDWYGIFLNGSGVYEGIGEFDYCLFRYGGYGGGTVDANVRFDNSDSGHMEKSTSEHSGQHGVWIDSCSPQITNSTFHNNVLSGLYASGTGTPTITGNTFNDNDQYGAQLVLSSITPLISNNTGNGNRINAIAFQGNVTADQTWTSTPGFPIVLLNSVTVSDNVRLTITPGTVIKFGGLYQLLVYGTLDANGTDVNKVVFTSLKDDEYDGDTNGDGTATAPAVGDWYGIFLNGSGVYEGIGEFDYCLFRYGGYGGGTVDANVRFDNSDSGHMEKSTSEHSGQHGVWIDSCSPQITNSTISKNTRFGLSVTTAAPRIINSIIWGNTSGGISGGTPVVLYSDIQGGFAGEGNIAEDPLFLDAANGDYHLDTCSPAVDAGDPVEILTADYSAGTLVIAVDRMTTVAPGDTIWITDGVNFESAQVASASATSVNVLTGFANSYSVANRSYLFTATSDFAGEPDPNGRRINMGAYGGSSEAAPTLKCLADLDGNDQDVDGTDLVVFMSAYGTSSGNTNYNPEADFNKDGVINIIDLFVFAEEFGRDDCEACP